MDHRSVATSARASPPPSWIETKSDTFFSTSIDWEALRKFAVAEKHKITNENIDIPCELTPAYREGGLHVVRRLEFGDGETWIARVQKTAPSADTCKRLLHEVYTIRALQERSNVPIPRIIAYCTTEDSPFAAGFTIQQYFHADTAMNVLGQDFSKIALMEAGCEERYYGEMARIQAEMSSVRFPMIGCITETSNGFSVGSIPGIGGPFKTPAEFFQQWAEVAVFPHSKESVKRYAPPEYFDKAWNSILGFPSQVARFAESYHFQEGPFPVIHCDLYRSNILMGDDCKVKAVIDWEDAIVAPWELVEFIKDLWTLPAALSGPLHRETLSGRDTRGKQRRYVQYVREAEKKQCFDSTLSMMLSNTKVQGFAQAFWLWRDGKVGFYQDLEIFKPCDVADALLHR